LRRLARIASACTVLFFTTFAGAQIQQMDIAVGYGRLLAFKDLNASQALIPPQEKGGVFPSVSFDAFVRNRLGFNAETSWEYKKVSYDGYESYRPIFIDANALFEPQIRRKLSLDLMAGVGVNSNRFYLPGMTGCTGVAGTCYVSSDHFMEHASLGVRYYVWHRIPHIFIRPEIHYYHIQNNVEFHSDNVYRATFSVGYTFHNTK
jgi:hypothetical protein